MNRFSRDLKKITKKKKIFKKQSKRKIQRSKGKKTRYEKKFKKVGGNIAKMYQEIGHHKYQEEIKNLESYIKKNNEEDSVKKFDDLCKKYGSSIQDIQVTVALQLWRNNPDNENVKKIMIELWRNNPDNENVKKMMIEYKFRTLKKLLRNLFQSGNTEIISETEKEFFTQKEVSSPQVPLQVPLQVSPHQSLGKLVGSGKLDGCTVKSNGDIMKMEDKMGHLDSLAGFRQDARSIRMTTWWA